MATNEKDLKYAENGGHLAASDEKRGSIYQHIPPSERRTSVQGRRISVVDDIFGEIKEGGPNYRNVGWLGGAILMVKTQIGLGVLSIPSVLDTLGMGPGLVVLIVIGAMTTWSNYEIGVFKRNHPSVYGIDDVGGKLLGRVGKEVMAVVFVLFWIFVAAAGILGISISLNAVSFHGTCTAVFVVVAALIGFLFGSIQTLHEVSWLAWVGATSILSAILTLTIAVSLQNRPAAAPTTGTFVSDWHGVSNPSFQAAMSACSSIVFAWAGTPAFFQIASEMAVPAMYTRSLLLCQSIVGVTYVVIGVVVYYYCGRFEEIADRILKVANKASYVSSPALGSAGPLLKKICYGLALPGLCVSTLLFVHIAAKYCFVRILRGSHHLIDLTKIHWTVWLSCTASITLIAYIIAEAIPVFGPLVSLIGALFGTLMCFQPFACMWWYDNWHNKRTPRWYVMMVFTSFIFVAGWLLLIGGTYGSAIDIKNAKDRTAPWSCADNSNSVHTT